MTVKIRLARGGAKKRPYYRLVVANVNSPRDGSFIEKVGSYNPLLPQEDKNRVVLKVDRIEYWLNIGAQPTDRVIKLIAAAGVSLPAFVQKEVMLRNKSHKVADQ